MTGMYLKQDAPRDWPRPVRPRALINASFLMSLLTLLLLKLAIDGVRDGSFRKAFIRLAMAGCLACFVAQFLAAMRQIRASSDPPRTGVNDISERGPAFPHSLRTFAWTLMSLAMTAVAAVALGVTLIRLDVLRSLLLVVVCFAVAGFLLWTCLFIIRRGRGRLVLTPSGVYHRTGLTDQFTPWDTITDVRAWNGPAPSFVIDFALTSGLRAHSSLGRFGADVQALPYIVCPAATFRGQTVPAYRAVRYYFENPDRRHEIGR